MKMAVRILWFGMVAMVTGWALSIDLFCYGPDGWEPLDTETVVITLFALMGVVLGLMLIRYGTYLRPAFFWLWFVLYQFAFTLPALAGTYYAYTFLSLGQ
ncbi:MAG: hypothetical protein JSS76_10795 [Bacteroidetes bacterium]|nr:hypothetical protein [Bacteroidota bacterium]MBS1685237.1 hypothetical protein [Bacteroidota bacterium]